MRVFGITTVRNAAGRMAVVEAEWPRKLILRASADVRLEIGSHGAQGIGPLELSDWCRFLHAPIRTRRTLVRAAEHGRRVRDARPPDVGWQKLLMAEAGDVGALGEQWRLNSWGRGRTIGPGGSALVGDTALARAVRPWALARPATGETDRGEAVLRAVTGTASAPGL